MTTSAPRRKTHFLSALHLLACLALGCWMATFFWRHTPARALFQRATQPRKVEVTPGVTGALGRSASARAAGITATVEAGLGDAFLGAAALGLLALGTGVYVRRLEIWLQARSSGEAVAVGTTDLRDAALAANDLGSGGRT